MRCSFAEIVAVAVPVASPAGATVVTRDTVGVYAGGASV